MKTCLPQDTTIEWSGQTVAAEQNKDKGVKQ